MWMLCVVVLYCLDTGDSYPYIGKDKMIGEIRNYMPGTPKERTDRPLPDHPEKPEDGDTDQTVSEKYFITLQTANDAENLNDSVINADDNNNTTVIENSTDSGQYRNKNMSLEKLTNKSVADLSIHDEDKTNNNQFSSYLIHLPYYLQKYLQKENPLKGFLRETILVPGHRKQRHRRSYFFDFDMLPDFPDDEETDVVFSAHTSPCNWSDRFYCLNGGTCVFVHALEIKTCR